MKRKFLSFILCLGLIFSNLSFSYGFSFSIPVGMIKNIGYVIYSVVDTTLTIDDALNYGMSFYDSLSKEKQQELIINYNNMVYDDYLDYLTNELKENNKLFHFDLIRKFEISDSYGNTYLDKHNFSKISIQYGTSPLELSIYKTGNLNNWSQVGIRYPYWNDNEFYSIHYSSSSNNTCNSDLGCSYNYNNTLYYEFKKSPVKPTKSFIRIGCSHDSGQSLFRYQDYGNHDIPIPEFDLNFSTLDKNNYPSYESPTTSDLEMLQNKYPGRDFELGDKPIEDNKPGVDNNPPVEDNKPSNPVITNPPSFPNLQEFDFTGLKLDSLTNLFTNFKTKFPFSLPFDIVNLIDGLVCDPIPPIFEADILDNTIVLDFTKFEELANLIRMFTLLGYVVSLIFVSKRFGG